MAAARAAPLAAYDRRHERRGVTDPPPARSAGVRATAAPPAPEPVLAIDAGEPLSVSTFEAFYRTTVDDLFAYVATLVRDRAAAEDVVAASYERAYRRLRTYDARRGSTRQWLFGIARHAALDELRRRKRVATLAVEPGAPEPTAEDDVPDPVRRATVRAALAALEPRDRELIALKFFAGLDNGEIAGVLGVSPSNAGTRLHRAVHRLREACHAQS
jgi:RNA polymerase sigma-70 factor, ECF subfamily